MGGFSSIRRNPSLDIQESDSPCKVMTSTPPEIPDSCAASLANSEEFKDAREIVSTASVASGVQSATSQRAASPPTFIIRPRPSDFPNGHRTLSAVALAVGKPAGDPNEICASNPFWQRAWDEAPANARLVYSDEQEEQMTRMIFEQGGWPFQSASSETTSSKREKEKESNRSLPVGDTIWVDSSLMNTATTTPPSSSAVTGEEDSEYEFNYPQCLVCTKKKIGPICTGSIPTCDRCSSMGFECVPVKATGEMMKRHKWRRERRRRTGGEEGGEEGEKRGGEGDGDDGDGSTGMTRRLRSRFKKG